MAEPPTPDPLLEQALAAARAGDFDAALAMLETPHDPAAMVRRHGKLAGFYYNEQKKVAAMIRAANAGVERGVKTLETAADGRAVQLELKKLTYNIAANCWPGWDDPGIVITPDQLKAAIVMAEFSRKTVLALDLGEKQRAQASWLVGALDLAIGRGAEAAKTFAETAAHFQAADLPAEIKMAAAYQALATGDTAAFNDTVAVLKDMASEDAAFYAAQLETAHRIFAAA